MSPELSTVVPDAGGRVRYGRDGLIVALILLLTGMAAVFSLPRASQAQLEPVAIVFPPWMSRADVVASAFAAGHLVLRSGRWPSIVVVAPGTGAALARTRPQGAMLMLPLAGLAGCLDSQTRPENSA